MAKKKTTAINEKALEVQDNESVIDVNEVKIDTEEIAKSLDAVDTTIKEDNAIQEIEAKIKEEMKPIQEIEEKVKDIMSNQEQLNKVLSENPEKASEIVMNEIKKAEALKGEVEKIINSTKVEKPGIAMTSWWNGMNFDL
jgi:hypothetical protein